MRKSIVAGFFLFFLAIALFGSPAYAQECIPGSRTSPLAGSPAGEGICSETNWKTCNTATYPYNSVLNVKNNSGGHLFEAVCYYSTQYSIGLWDECNADGTQEGTGQLDSPKLAGTIVDFGGNDYLCHLFEGKEAWLKCGGTAPGPDGAKIDSDFGITDSGATGYTGYGSDYSCCQGNQWIEGHCGGVVDVELDPNSSGVFVLLETGEVAGIGGASASNLLASGQQFPWWALSVDARAVGLEIIFNGRGAYILDNYGGRHAVGQAPIINCPFYPGWDIVRDLEFTYNTFGIVDGFYVLDGYGLVYACGNADSSLVVGGYSCGQGNLCYTSGVDQFVDIELSPDETRIYQLSNRGEIFYSGSSSSHLAPGSAPLFSGGGATDLELNLNDNNVVGVYVVNGNHSLGRVGSTRGYVDAPGGNPPTGLFVDLEFSADFEKMFVLSYDGNAGNFGNNDGVQLLQAIHEDIDGDGVEDSEDLCSGTASGAVVDGFGCSCAQKLASSAPSQVRCAVPSAQCVVASCVDSTGTAVCSTSSAPAGTACTGTCTSGSSYCGGTTGEIPFSCTATCNSAGTCNTVTQPGTICTSFDNMTCSNGNCACESGYADCDGSQSNGCEININSSRLNCGQCGLSCSAGRECINAVCAGQANAECDADSDCRGDETCSSNDRCVSISCGACEIARNHACVSRCASGDVCRSNVCVPAGGEECDSDSDCGSGQECVSGACETVVVSPTSCDNDADCQDDEKCDEGFCEEVDCGECGRARSHQCAESDDLCANNERCENLQCVPLNCPEGQVVSNHGCVVCSGVACGGVCRSDAGVCCFGKWNSGIESCEASSAAVLASLLGSGEDVDARSFYDKASASQQSGFVLKAEAEARIGIALYKKNALAGEGKDVSRVVSLIDSAKASLASGDFDEAIDFAQQAIDEAARLAGGDWMALAAFAVFFVVAASVLGVLVYFMFLKKKKEPFEPKEEEQLGRPKKLEEEKWRESLSAVKGKPLQPSKPLVKPLIKAKPVERKKSVEELLGDKKPEEEEPEEEDIEELFGATPETPETVEAKGEKKELKKKLKKGEEDQEEDLEKKKDDIFKEVEEELGRGEDEED